MSQLELIPSELLPDNYRVPDDPTGRSTGERIKRDRPDIYEAVLMAGAEGMGIRQTARALNIHRDTVAAIFEREPDRIGTLKERTVRNLDRFITVASERMLEEVDDYSLAQLGIGMGIAVDKRQLLSGQVTSITEHRDGAKRISNLDDLLEEMKRATPTGPEAEARGQKAIAAQIGGQEIANPTLKGASVDSESTGVTS